MTHKLYIILPTMLLMLAICSCGSSKKAHRQAEVLKVVSESKSSDSSSVIKEYLKTETSSSCEDLQIIITEYDTTQAVDSTTGKPPVKKEVKVDKRKETKKKSEDDGSEKLESKSTVAEQVQVQDSIYIDSVREKTETTVPKQIGNVVWAACALIGLLIVWYLVRRFGKR